ncbi:unnamed protein product [Soboliphyme baturini]|uniref:GIDA domain-containing protein n=1 Tax=Soboliphyme baturini TaxID=241478 RepID=A0A183IZC7_9BILA|nr:unnamed protein product [Soboliphyme baturini]
MMDCEGGKASYKKLKHRLRRNFYYGSSRMDRLSIPLTDFTVEYLDRNCPFGYVSPDYVSKISKDGAISPVTLIVALVYLERLRLCNKDVFEDSDPEDLINSALVNKHTFNTVQLNVNVRTLSGFSR